MVILPNQAGVALGLLAFSVASIVGIASGVTLEIAILRGGFAFIIFVCLGWLLAYIIYDDETAINNEMDMEFENDTVEISPKGAAASAPEKITAEAKPEANAEETVNSETQHLKPPDDSDF